MKQLAEDKNDADTKVKEATDALQKTIGRVESLNNTFERKIQTPLIRSNPEKYLKDLDGKKYEN